MKLARIVMIPILAIFMAVFIFAVNIAVFANSLYTVGGTLTGLTESVVLQNNGEDNLLLTQDGDFTFETALIDGVGYLVTVKTHPTNQTCTATMATGLIAGANVTDIAVACGPCGNETGNGNQFIQGPDGPEGSDFDQVFRSLTVHPLDPNTILMGTERNGFVLSTDGGNAWKRLRKGLRHTETMYPEIWDVAFDPTDPSVIYAATLDSPGPVTGDYPSSIAGVYKSTDGGDSWVRSNCGMYNSRINSVIVDAANPLNVIAGMEGGEATFSALLGQYFDGGIYRSTDGGGSWSKVLIDDNDVKNGFWRMVAYGPSGNHFITFGLSYYDLSKNIGFIRSTDAGITWEMFAAPLKPLLIVGFDVSQDGQVIYANERDSYEIHLSTDGGTTWNTTAPNQANGPIAVSPNDSQLVIYAGFKTLYRSTDGLTTYQSVLSAPAKIDDIVIAPSDPTIVYVATAGYLLYKSTDSGASFTLMKDIRSDVLNQTNPLSPVLNLLLF